MANSMSAAAGRDEVPFDLGGQPDARKIASAAALASIEAASQRATGDMELRVLDGASAGRRLAWGDADTLVVATRGPSFDWSTCATAGDAGAASVPPVGDPDLVLLEFGAPTRIVMSRHMFHASVTVLDGEVWVGERSMTRGARFVLSMYARLRMGDSILAFGQNLLGSWPTQTQTQTPVARATTPKAECRPDTVAAPKAERHPDTAATPKGESRPDTATASLPPERDVARAPRCEGRPSVIADAEHPRAEAAVIGTPRASVPADATSIGEIDRAPLTAAHPGRGAGRAVLWTTTGFGLALACAAAIWLAVPGASRPAVPDPAAALRAELDAGSFRDLTLELREGGRWRLRGRVASEADRAALERLLARRGLDVEAEIFVTDAIARRGAEPTRIDGQSVDAPVGEGGVDVPVSQAPSAPGRVAPVVQAKDRVPAAAPETIRPVTRVAPPPPESPVAKVSPPERAAPPGVTPAAKAADRKTPESAVASVAKAERAGMTRPSAPVAPDASAASAASVAPVAPAASVAPPVPAQIPPLSLGLELSTGTRGLLPGEALTFRVRPNRAGHVYCFMQVDTRHVLRIFPNRFQTDSRVGPAGIELPGDVPFGIRMNMNRQTESIACFVTEQDVVARLPGRPGAFDLTPLPVAGLGEVEATIARLTDGVFAHKTVVMRPL